LKRECYLHYSITKRGGREVGKGGGGDGSITKKDRDEVTVAWVHRKKKAPKEPD